MKKRIKPCLLIITTFLLVLSGTSGALFASEPAGNEASDQAIKAQLASVQIPFIQNEGQIDDPAVKFYANTFAGTAYVTDSGITYSLSKDEEGENKTCEVRETLTGAKEGNPVGVGSSGTIVNLYSGNDSSKWRTKLPAYNQVSLGEVYNGVELSLKAYGNNVEKVFTVQPGGDPQDIRFTIDGAESLQVNANGELEIGTVLSNLILTRPIAYQEINGQKMDVAVGYVLQGSGYGFELEAYNPVYPLVIDPMLAGTFGSAMNGGGNYFGANVPIIFKGDYVYVAGYIATNGNDAVVYKFSKDLKSRVATILSGSKNDRVTDMVMDNSGNIFVVGSTDSTDQTCTRFPVVGTGSIFSMAVPSSDTTTRKRTDLFVAKLRGDDLTALACTSFGDDNNDYGYGIALDSSGNVFVTGNASYSSVLPYPTTNGAVSIVHPNITNMPAVVVTKLSNNLNGGLQADGITPITDRPMASTFLGGTSATQNCSIAINNQDKIYVAVYTGSSVYPIPAAPYIPYDSSLSGASDGVISELSNDLTSLEAGTFLGGSQIDVINDLALDSSGNVYVTGYTVHTGNFPTTAELGAHDTTVTGTQYDMFVAKLKGDLTGPLIGGALFGSTSTSYGDYGTSLVLSNDSIYVAGYAPSTFPTTSGAYKSTLSGNTNIFALKIDQAFTTLIASTFICQGYSTSPNPGLALDSDGTLYVAGYTAGTVSSVPVTEGSFNTTTGGPALFKMTNDLLSYWPAGSALTLTGKTATSVDLSWTAAVDSPPSYRILKGGTIIDTVSAGVGTTYHVAGLTPNTSYTFKVEAGDPALSNWSIDGPSVTTTTENDTAPPTWPSPGTSLTVSDVTASGLTLTWTPATDNTAVTGYRIYQDSNLLGTVDGNVFTYTVGGLTQSTQYTFKIEAGDTYNNWSSDGPAKTVMIDLQAPAWPEGSSLTTTNAAADRLTLNWPAATDNVGVTGYRIYHDSTLLGTVPSSMLSYNITGLNAGAAYTFKVEAGDDSGNWSTDGPSVTAGDIVAPSWPLGSTLTAVANGGYAVNLTWSEAADNKGVTGYRIYQDGTLLDTVTGTAYAVTNLSPGTTYTFKVEAGDAADNWSAGGPSATIMTPQINISLNLSKQVGAEGDTITASGIANPNTWVTVKVIDSMQDIKFVDVTQSDEGGNYSMDFQIPTGANGPLTVVAGYGNNVATAGLAMAGDSGELAAKIDEAAATITAAVEGTGYGNYAVGSKAILQAAIDEAQAVLDDAANQSQEQLDAATAALNEALTIFEAGKVTIAAPKYTVTADSDPSYDNGQTPDGITFMTVKSGVSGLKYFSVSISPVIPHEGNEVVVFVLIRGGVQQTLSATKADFDMVDNAKAGFNVQSGDIVKAYIVDDLTNAVDCNPIILQ